jgi:uncharacterized protein (TIGR02453 family)
MPDRFSGFPREGITFFRQLARNNNRNWFQAHKDTYEQCCRAPMQALVQELDPLGATRVSRIYRDMRFARGGAPYKTYIAGGAAAVYVSLSAEGVWAGAGLYKPDPVRLNRLRAAIDHDQTGQELEAIVRALRRKGYDVDTHAMVSSAPRGYRADHPRIDLLRMKDIYAGRQFGPEPWLSTRKALDRVRQVMADTSPLVAWLKDNVGRGERAVKKRSARRASAR